MRKQNDRPALYTLFAISGSATITASDATDILKLALKRRERA